MTTFPSEAPSRAAFSIVPISRMFPERLKPTRADHGGGKSQKQGQPAHCASHVQLLRRSGTSVSRCKTTSYRNCIRHTPCAAFSGGTRSVPDTLEFGTLLSRSAKV